MEISADGGHIDRSIPVARVRCNRTKPLASWWAIQAQANSAYGSAIHNQAW